jgi:hypothetical protein
MKEPCHAHHARGPNLLLGPVKTCRFGMSFYSALIIQLSNFQVPNFLEKIGEPKQSLNRWQKAKRLVAFGQTWIFGIPELALNWVLKIKTCSSHSHQ